MATKLGTFLSTQDIDAILNTSLLRLDEITRLRTEADHIVWGIAVKYVNAKNSEGNTITAADGKAKKVPQYAVVSLQSIPGKFNELKLVVNGKRKALLETSRGLALVAKGSKGISDSNLELLIDMSHNWACFQGNTEILTILKGFYYPRHSFQDGKKHLLTTELWIDNLTEVVKQQGKSANTTILNRIPDSIAIERYQKQKSVTVDTPDTVKALADSLGKNIKDIVGEAKKLGIPVKAGSDKLDSNQVTQLSAIFATDNN